jgi:hypothetical protein
MVFEGRLGAAKAARAEARNQQIATLYPKGLSGALFYLRTYGKSAMNRACLIAFESLR